MPVISFSTFVTFEMTLEYVYRGWGTTETVTFSKNVKMFSNRAFLDIQF